MSEHLQEYCDSRGVAVAVDAGRSVVRGVKILGLESKNGRSYSPKALEGAVALYEGAKVNVNHSKGGPLAPRDYQDRIGSIRDVSLRTGEGLFGDFHFNPKHALAEQLTWDAEHSPENVGFSHNVEARTSRRGDQVIVEAILKVQSVDLVADPATTRGLFESRTGSALESNTDSKAVSELTIKQLRSLRPDLVETIVAEVQAERSELEAELDRLRAREAAYEQRAAAGRLLREFGLPDPESGDRLARQITSESFVESLMAAADEAEMRRLVEERARLVEQVRRASVWPSSGVGAARSREQSRVDCDRSAPASAAEFAKAIS